MRQFFIIFCLGFFTSSAFSIEQEQAPIDRLFEAMDADAMVDNMYQQMSAMFDASRQQMNITKEEEPIFDKHVQRMVKLMQTEVSWEKLLPDMRAVYLQNFTEKEIQDLIDFYESPTGQSFVKKMPIITQESMQVGMRHSMALMPKIKELSDQLVTELQEYRAANSQ